MSVADDRRTVLESFDSEGAELMSAIEGLSETALEEPSLNGWSVKDHLSHLAQWEELRYLDTVRIAAGYRSAVDSTPAQDEVFNQMTVEWRRSHSLAQVLWELETARRRVLDAVATLSDEELARVLTDSWPLGARVIEGAMGHEAEHAGWIRAWRAERSL